ncbi:MAG: hypothetical protein AB3X44_15575 [Leptothrix sp. (in: b-proteobacteria)]
MVFLLGVFWASIARFGPSWRHVMATKVPTWPVEFGFGGMRQRAGRSRRNPRMCGQAGSFSR